MKLIGSLELKVDPLGLKAEIVYQKDQMDLEWDSDKVIKFLFKKGIIDGFDPATIDKALKRLSTGVTDRVSVAEGIPPQNPTEEEILWESFSIPEYLKETSGVFILKQPNPKNNENKINPADLKTGYVKEKQLIGTIKPGKEGKPGKNIYGRIIPPQRQSEPVILGPGIKKSKNELTAEYSGIIRLGDSWADIVSFKAHEWAIIHSPDKVSAFLDFEPSSMEIPLPPGELIYQEALKLVKQEENLLPAEEINKILFNAARDNRRLQAFPISPDREGSFSLDISEDKLKATLTLKKGQGSGTPLELKAVGAAIRGSKLKGLDLERIRQDILSFYRGPNLELKEYLLTEGTPASLGEKREFSLDAPFLNETSKNRILEQVKNTGLDIYKEIKTFDEFPWNEKADLSLVIRDQIVGKLSSATKGDAGVDVFGRVIEGFPGDAPVIKTFENVKLDKDAVVVLREGLLQVLKDEDAYYFRVLPHKDSVIEIKISSDKMSASLSLYREDGAGRPLSREAIDKAITEKGIIRGIDSEMISKALGEALNTGISEDKVFAQGQPARDASSGKIEFTVDLASGKRVSIDKTGKADFRHQDRITSVKAEERIARITAPLATPQDGWDITGKPIIAKSAPALGVEIGNFIRQEKDAEGNITLYAEKNGELVYEKNRLEIRDIYSVPGDVDLKCGNIKFPGSVYVKGSILPGFYIIAGGDIKINENVDAALLSAEGSIYVNQGVKGGNKGVLRAKKDVYAGFLEQANLMVVGDVKIKNSCLRCNIKSNGKLSLESEKGVLIGGKIRARKGISALNLGSENMIRTEISFGQDYLIADQIELEEREIEKLKDTLSKMDFSMKKLEHHGRRGALETVRAEKLKLLKIMEKRSLRLFALREKFEEHFPAEIIVRGTIFPRVVFESHGRFLEITKPKKGVIFYFDPAVGQIKEKPM